MKPLADICSCSKLKLTSLFSFSSENQTQFYIFIELFLSFFILFYFFIYLFNVYFHWKRDKNTTQESHVLQTRAIVEISYMIYLTLQMDVAWDIKLISFVMVLFSFDCPYCQ